jgi:hypothetical protein
MKTKIMGLLAVALLAGPMVANAAIIDFAGEADGEYAILDGSPATYEISGYTFAGHFLFTTAGAGCSEGGCNTISGESGQISDFFKKGAPVMTLTQSNGGAFSLSSLDAAVAYLNLSSSFNATSLTIVGTLLGGGTVSQGIGLDLGASTMVFDSNWSNLISIEFVASGSLNDTNAFVVDNIVLSPVSVPEPGTLALLGLGLVGMGMRRRIKAS